MTNIKGNKVTLRAVEPSDIDYLYEWENDTDVWGVSGTTSPFSHYTLSLFIEAQREDIFTSKQMRLMICDTITKKSVGAVDIFEFDPLNHRAGVGIMTAPAFRGYGYAKDALLTLESYASQYLRVHQLWCNILEDNQASINLFTSIGYNGIGTKRDWVITSKGYKDEIMFQKILDIE